MLKLTSELINDLLGQAESGMGYQIVQAAVDDDRTKRGVVFNSELLVFDDEPIGDFARHFRFIEYEAALQLLHSSGLRVKSLQVVSQAGRPTSLVKEPSSKYGKQTGGAADAPREETKAGDEFRRFSAFRNDRRIRS